MYSIIGLSRNYSLLTKMWHFVAQRKKSPKNKSAFTPTKGTDIYSYWTIYAKKASHFDLPILISNSLPIFFFFGWGVHGGSGLQLPINTLIPSWQHHLCQTTKGWVKCHTSMRHAGARLIHGVLLCVSFVHGSWILSCFLSSETRSEKWNALELGIYNSTVSHRVDQLCDPAWLLRASTVIKSCNVLQPTRTENTCCLMNSNCSF